MTTYKNVKENDTSVKSLGIIEEPTPTKAGVCDFIYRDQYSVFDWGKMPMPETDTMDNRPVAIVAAFNHELLAEKGIPVCYLGTVDKDGDAHPLDWFKGKDDMPRALRVHMVNIIKPTFNQETRQWDYSAFQNPPANNYVLPLEFIWRKDAGPDSSFWKWIEKGVYKLSDFGLPDTLKRGDAFPEPILDHSSKYEDHDRYFSPKVAQELGGFSDSRWAVLDGMRRDINRALYIQALTTGFYRPDGKQEFVTIDGKDMLGDVAGTWHEDRIERHINGKVVKVSKQTPRDLNALLNAEWAKQCTDLKAQAEKEGFTDWKKRVTVQPIPLEPAFFTHYNNLMRAATNAWIGWNIFSDASPIEEACIEFDRYLADYKGRLKK